MPTNAAIYIADPSILGSRTFNAIEDITSYEGISDGDQATGVLLRFTWGSIAVNFMPAEQLAGHLAGFKAYAETVIEDNDTLIYALARIHHVRMCLGCVIQYSPASEVDAQRFLFRFNSELGGLLFLYDSIFDRDGSALGGAEAKQ